MKCELSTTEAAGILISDTCAGWSRAGAYALVEYMEELEADTGETIEFDRVALRCDFSEYATALEAAQEFGFDYYDLDAEETIREATRWLEYRTTVIPFDGGVIVQAF